MSSDAHAGTMSPCLTMKLTDFSGFEPLNSLKEKMGIPRDSFGSFNLTLDF